MSEEEAQDRGAGDGITAVGDEVRWRRGWQQFLTALLRALSAWVV
jgi:hypothetical protein